MTRRSPPDEVSALSTAGNLSLMKRIVNRRNAAFGWLAWKVGKRAARARVRKRRRTLFVVAVGSLAALVVGGASLAVRREPQL